MSTPSKAGGNPGRPSTSDEAQAVAAALGFREQGQCESLDCGSHSAPDQQQSIPKRLATVSAELARRGYELWRADGGFYVIARWDFARATRSFHAVLRFAKTAGIE